MMTCSTRRYLSFLAKTKTGTIRPVGAGAVMGAPQIAWGPLTPPTRTDHPTPTRPTTEETDLRHNIEEADKLPEEVNSLLKYFFFKYRRMNMTFP